MMNIGLVVGCYLILCIYFPLGAVKWILVFRFIRRHLAILTFVLEMDSGIHCNCYNRKNR